MLQLQPAEMTSSTALSDAMTSVLHRRRPRVTLTLDAVAAPRYSPPAAAPVAPGPAGPSRRSSASIDSGYGSSSAASPVAFPVIDIFSPGPRGPMTAPLPSVGSRLQSPGAAWFGPYAHLPPNAVSSHRPRRPIDSNNDLCFVFDGLAIRQ